MSANSNLRIFVSFGREFKNSFPLVSYSDYMQLVCDLSKQTWWTSIAG